AGLGGELLERLVVEIAEALIAQIPREEGEDVADHRGHRVVRELRHFVLLRQHGSLRCVTASRHRPREAPRPRSAGAGLPSLRFAPWITGRMFSVGGERSK